MTTKVTKTRSALVPHPTKAWLGAPPATCDLCKHDITRAFIDGATKMGPWANMCAACFPIYGVGLGTGRGQRYELQPESGRWTKMIPESEAAQLSAKPRQPSLEQLQEWDRDGVCEATDGCTDIEPDGECEHGKPSWFRKLGYV